jgi:hypothetical protein
MKRVILGGFLLLALVNAHADISTDETSRPCGRIEDYTVEETSFEKLPLNFALTKITKGMPFQIVIDRDADILVSADSVSGTLASVLDLMAHKSGFTYSQNRCVLRIKLAKKDSIWTVNPGVNLLSVLTEWGNDAGWQIAWEAPKDYTVGANFSAAGSYEDAVTALIEVINRNGINLHATLYYGNQVLRVIKASDIKDAAQHSMSAVEKSNESWLPLTEVKSKDVPARSTVWVLDKTSTLKDNLDRWSSLAGWNPVVWDASNYFQVNDTSTLKGNFETVLRMVAVRAKLNICLNEREKTVHVTDAALSCKD